jgi:alpha-tubulin suppressor-like RCC1 family protein
VRVVALVRCAVVAIAPGLLALGCGGPSKAAAPEPRAIVVGPALDAGPSLAAPEPAAPAGDEVAPFDLALGMTRVCVRASGKIHCTADFSPERPLTAAAPLEGIDDAIHIALGRDFGCAVTRAGAVMCFGDNTYGQLGANLRVVRSDKPVTVIGVAGARRVVASDTHACALVGDGTVRCWGRNDSGQTGGRTSYLPAARELVSAETLPVKDVKLLASSNATTCALGRTQEATCWGRSLIGGDGALGRGSANERPTVAVDLARFEDLTASEGAFCGIRGGEVFCWGETWSLVKAPGMGSSKPVSVNLGRARRVRMAHNHACALLVDGGVTCWGANYYGALGRGETTGFDALPPELVKGLPPSVDIATGGSMSCAITGAREVFCWGSWPHTGNAERKEVTPVKIRVTS